jgi:hypothetical protein
VEGCTVVASARSAGGEIRSGAAEVGQGGGEGCLPASMRVCGTVGEIGRTVHQFACVDVYIRNISSSRD